MTTVALVLASVALAVAGIALGLAITVMRQNGHTTEVLRRHRIKHHKAEGYADPEPLEDLPPARGAHRYAPPTGTAPTVTRDQVEPDAPEQIDDRWRTHHDDAPTVARPRPEVPR